MGPLNKLKMYSLCNNRVKEKEYEQFHSAVKSTALENAYIRGLDLVNPIAVCENAPVEDDAVPRTAVQ